MSESADGRIQRIHGVERPGAAAIYRWTLTGTHTGPGGTGVRIRISGYERWRFGLDSLVVESRGHFDAAEYQRQLDAGSEPA